MNDSPRSQQDVEMRDVSQDFGTSNATQILDSPRSARLHRKSSVARKSVAGLPLGDGHNNEITKPPPEVGDDDDDEWAPLESWKAGDWAFVTTNEAKLEECFSAAGLEPCEGTPYMGKVGRVKQVAQGKILQVSFKDPKEAITSFPTSVLKKTHVMPFSKEPHETPDDLGLELRSTHFGGPQIVGTEPGSHACRAGMDDFSGWWLTHADEKQIHNVSDFVLSGCTTVRMEKRVTLPYSFAATSLEEKIEGAILASDLRVYIIFVALFVAFFIVDRDVESSFYVTQNMRGAVLGNEIPSRYDDPSGLGCLPGYTSSAVKWEKTYTDLANVGDWNLWVLSMAIPTILHESQFGRAVSGNILLGGIRFRTIRMRSDSCGINADIIPNKTGLAAEQRCYGPYSMSGESKGNPGDEIKGSSYLPTFNPTGFTADTSVTSAYRSCSQASPESSWSPPVVSGQIAFYHCGGYMFEIPFYKNSSDGTLRKTTATEAVDRYKQYACADWADDVATRLVSMEFYEYSPSFDTLLSVRIFYEVASGGAWLPTDQLRTFLVWTADRKTQTALDMIFLLFVLYYFGDFAADVRRQSRRNRPLLRHFLQSWTILEFLNLFLFLTSFGFRFAWYAASDTSGVKIDQLEKSGKYPGDLDQIEWLYMMQIYVNSCNVVFTFLKLLKFLRLNSRMNILTATLSDCQDSIIGVLLIFILVVLAFSVTGNTLFGTQMFEYRNLSASFSTLMRMLMGEFDYESMKRENRVLAGLFFWGFIVLGLFILLNFLIGVISESFGNVSGRTVPEPLDRLLDKAQNDFKLLCRSDVVKKWVHMRVLRCVTRESLLESCIDAIERWRDQTYVKHINDIGEEEYNEGEEIELQTITKQEFIGAISDVNDGQILRDLGTPYIRYIWTHLVYEFHRSQEAEQLQDAMRRQAAFERGCRIALSDKLRIIEQFTQRMDSFNGVLEHMKDLLDEHGVE